MTERGNLYRDVPRRLSEERFDELLATPVLRLERIVSTGQATPPGEWLEQDRDEWVLLLTGSARLRYEGGDPQPLIPGDWLLIPGGRRHRVEGTDPDQPTVWLALHFGPAG